MYRNVALSKRLCSSVMRVRVCNIGQIRFKTRFAYPAGMKAYEDDYVDVPQYPSVDYETRHYTHSVKAHRQLVRDWHESIRNKETIEEKLMEMNVDRAYGWKAFQLSEERFNSDALHFIKYITRTHTMPPKEFPDIYSSPALKSKVNHYVERLTQPLAEVIKFELYGVNRPGKDGESPADIRLQFDKAVANQVSRLMLQVLSADEPLLNQAQVDYLPKSEAFWFVGGFPLPSGKVEQLKKWEKEPTRDKNWLKEVSHKEEAFQYIGRPLIQVRSVTPMERFLPDDFKVGIEHAVEFPSAPVNYGYRKGLRYATNIPGHWSEDSAKANLLSFHSASFLESNAKDGTPEELDPAKHSSYIAQKPQMVESQTILTSFGRLVAQAYMLGFDQFGDIGYPLTTQTVTLNGLDWCFSTYQLNTIQFDNIQMKKNRKQNYNWTTPSLKILEEDTGNINPIALEMLLKFYLAPTLSTEQEFRTPNVKCKLNDVADDYKREFILLNFHEMYSQRRQAVFKQQIPEIYNWEKIYKIDHQTRPVDARKRFFMIPGNNPYTYKYLFKEPRYRPKRLKFLEAELEERKQAERVQAIKEAQANKYRNREDE